MAAAARAAGEEPWRRVCGGGWRPEGAARLGKEGEALNGGSSSTSDGVGWQERRERRRATEEGSVGGGVGMARRMGSL
jgi:hypothetical protein